MADQQDHAGGVGGGDHRVGVVEMRGHRFFYQHMFARGAGQRDMLPMQRSGRRHIRRVEAGMSQQRVDSRITFDAELTRGVFTHALRGVGNRAQLESRMRLQGWNERTSGGSEADDPNAEQRCRGRRHG